MINEHDGSYESAENKEVKKEAAGPVDPVADGEPEAGAVSAPGAKRDISAPGAKRDIFAPLRDVRVLAYAGILSAIAIALGFFKIPVTQVIEIRFAMLPVAAAAFLFGPAVGGVVGLVSDVGGYLIKPTGPFFPGLTITSIVAGILFGCFLYRRRPSVQRILAAQIAYTLVCGIFLNSFWLSMLYGSGFIPVMTARIVKELVMIPVNTVLLTVVLQTAKRLRVEQ